MEYRKNHKFQKIRNKIIQKQLHMTIIKNTSRKIYISRRNTIIDNHHINITV